MITRLGLIDKGALQKYYPTVAHEIGHVLALDHTFENTLTKLNSIQKYEDYKNNLLSHKSKLPLQIQELLDEKVGRDSEVVNSDRYKKRTASMEILSNNIVVFKEFIPYYEEWIESYEWFRDNLDNNLCYFINESMTDNIMDYYRIASKHKLFHSFYQRQWLIMQKDLAKYHHQ